MAPEWEMGMEFGMGMGAAAAPPGYGSSNCAPAYLYGLPSTDTLRIDDLLDFSNQDIFASSATESHHIPHQPDVSSGAGRESGSSSDCCYPQLSSSFADDIYIPSEEAAELEWLSKFVEDSFSDVPYPAASIPHTMSGNAQIRTDPASIPGRGARSKRSRASAAAAALTAATNWTSPPPLQIPTAQSSSSSSTSSTSSSSDFPTPRKRNVVGAGGADNGIGVDESGVRRCTHCGSEKTPQWRTGPLGPKTLCNACGVRYKSGRLVPEYRPAASPTFVLTQHSNSHRKVMELRRQKEVVHHQRQPNNNNNSVIYHDRLLPLS